MRSEELFEITQAFRRLPKELGQFVCIVTLGSLLAEMLGYSELSAFSNAFKQKTGLSPRQWRAQYVH